MMSTTLVLLASLRDKRFSDILDMFFSEIVNVHQRLYNFSGDVWLEEIFIFSFNLNIGFKDWTICVGHDLIVQVDIP